MTILNYADCVNKDYWTDVIGRQDWNAARFLTKLLRDGNPESYLSDEYRIFILADGDKLVSFMTYSRRDCIIDDTLFPWIGFVYTAPEYRGHHYAGKLIAHCESLAAQEGYKRVYIGTSHVGLYEKYGYTYMESRPDCFGDDCRIYFKDI